MIFSPQWFTRHQKILLWFANSWIGRRILCINGQKSSVGKNKIIKILPNSITWKGKKKREFVTEFRTHDKFGKRLFYAFKPFWYLCHLWDMTWYPRFNLGFDTLTQYPGTISGDNPDDMRVLRGAVTEDWATIKAGAGSSADRGADFVLLRATASSNVYQYLCKSIFCFDTSTLTSGAVKSATTFSLSGTGTAPQSLLGASPCDIVAATPNATTGIVAADFTQLGSVVFGSIAAASWNSTDGTYNDFTLNAAGMANVSNTGISSFGAALGWCTATGGTPTWGSLVDTAYYAYFSDQTGTTKDPKLVVTYTLPMGGYIFISS